MNPVSRSTDPWFNEVEPKRDSPLLLGDGTECSMLRNELEYFVRREKEAGGDPKPAKVEAEECKELEGNLVGLAFSGGGIRSATFGLGILEALKDLGLGTQFHFLSTVSGGGYLGAWLSANCARAAKRSAYNSDGGKSEGWLSRDAHWGGSISHLRRYSKYLSPDFGFASADTWSILTIWIRNALLIQFTVILAIAAVLLVPRLLMPVFDEWYYSGHLRWITVGLYLVAVVGIAANERRLLAAESEWMLELDYWRQGLMLSCAALLTAWVYAHWVSFEPFSNKPIDITTTVLIALLLMFATYCLIPAAVNVVNHIARKRKVARPPQRLNYTQYYVQILVVIPLMVDALLVAAVLWGQATSPLNPLSRLKTFGALFMEAWQYWPLPLIVGFVSFLMLSWCALPKMRSVPTMRRVAWVIVALVASAGAALALHVLLAAAMLLVHGWASSETSGGVLKAFVWVPALLIFAFSIAIVVLLGLLGRATTEAVREWWSRLGAWLAIYGAAWLIVAVAVVYGPLLVAKMFETQSWHGTSISLGWIATTAAGLLFGKSPSTSGEVAKGNVARVREWFTVIAPYVYIAGLVLAISTCLQLVIVANAFPDQPLTATSLVQKHWPDMGAYSAVTVLYVFVVTVVLLALFAARVDINEFSLNSFYRSRLVRCYLGATRPPQERKPQNFTGFDDKDDLEMHELKQSPGPLHIVNCALNLGGSSDLSLHTRHSASFTITPLSIGSHYQSGDRRDVMKAIGFRETENYGDPHHRTTLGQAISVSGAAASPNMGYHTSSVVAFVLTMFNARLGWWFARPQNKEEVQSSSPEVGVWFLLKELFASADDRSAFLMCSDGGHFENLGIYELVRRRCRVIVASDAECDPSMQFEGLGALKRMCEVDLKVTIDINVSSLLPDPNTGWSKNRCAVGRIIYDSRDRTKDGYLIYLKSCMSGHEDEGVLQYKAAHPGFPHESTGNQFYGEDQFESYRKLGYEIAQRAFLPVSVEIDAKDRPAKYLVVEDVTKVAESMESIWAPSLATKRRFSEHSDRLMHMWHQLGFGQAVSLFDPAQEKLFAEKWPDQESGDTFRGAFYMSSQIIQLMENVYLDLDLENTWDHPDNAGWQQQFKTWAKSPGIVKTWDLTSDHFGKRFRHFCELRLKMQPAKRS